MDYLVVVSAEMERLARDLTDAGSQLLDIADARRDLASLVASSPSPELRDAVTRLLERWELTVWDTADELQELGERARRTSEEFERVERMLRGGSYAGKPRTRGWGVART